jgi:hypothetical protein
MIFTHTWKAFTIQKVMKFEMFKKSKGENTIKGAMGAHVKVLFQGLHVTCVISMLVCNFKFYILDTQFNTTC